MGVDIPWRRASAQTDSPSRLGNSDVEDRDLIVVAAQLGEAVLAIGHRGDGELLRLERTAKR